MYDRILVPTDGSDASVRAAEEAFRIARESGASVHTVYVIDESASSLLFSDKPMAELLEALAEEGEMAVESVAERAGDVRVATDVIRGMGIHDAILEYATDNEVDLVVMATHGRQGIEHLLGSTTERVIAHSSLPVLVVDAGDREGEGVGDGEDE